MQDVKTRWPDDAIVDSDATSKETLEDLEENEQSSESQSGKSPAPSPDGALDEAPNKTDDAGPM